MIRSLLVAAALSLLLPWVACDSAGSAAPAPGAAGTLCDSSARCQPGLSCDTDLCLSCCPDSGACGEQCCGRCVWPAP